MAKVAWWPYGTILRNPGCDFYVMFIAPNGKIFDGFDALVIRERDDFRSKTGPWGDRSGIVVGCGGLPSDKDPWIVTAPEDMPHE